MELNRELQVKILEYLASIADRETVQHDFEQLKSFAEWDESMLAATLIYLERHDFLVSGFTMCGSEPMVRVCKIKITEKGQDFLEKDGGLTVIKNTITVRFHADTIALLESCVAQSTLTPQDKQAVRDKLRALPVSAIEHLMKQLLDAAVHRLPDALQLLRSVLP